MNLDLSEHQSHLMKPNLIIYNWIIFLHTLEIILVRSCSETGLFGRASRADFTGVFSDFFGAAGCAQAGFGFPLFVFLAVEREVERDEGISKTPFIFGFVRCLADTGADLIRIEDAKMLFVESEVIFSSSTIIFNMSHMCKNIYFC